MFDSYCVGRVQREYVPYDKTIIEKRAPTDDSIKIYNEMREKAFKSIIDTLVTKDNVFNFKAMLSHEECSYSMVLRYEYTLNGEVFKGEAETEETGDIHGIIYKLYGKLAGNISREIMERALKEGGLR
jgi:hypothetical protein